MATALEQDQKDRIARAAAAAARAIARVLPAPGQPLDLNEVSAVLALLELGHLHIRTQAGLRDDPILVPRRP